MENCYLKKGDGWNILKESYAISVKQTFLFEVEKFDFNVTNNVISESRYLKVRSTKYILAEYYLWSWLTHIKLFTTSRFRTTSCQKGKYK